MINTSLTANKSANRVCAGLLAMLLTAVAFAAIGAEQSKAAAISNPGPVTLKITSGSLALPSKTIPIQTSTPTVPGLDLSVTAQIDATGALAFVPQSLGGGTIQVPLSDAPGATRIPVTLAFNAPAAGSGTLDPSTGQLKVVLPLSVEMTATLGSPSTCRLGPLTLDSLDTDASGGARYDGATGTATIVKQTMIPPLATVSGGLCNVFGGLLGLGTTGAPGTLTLSLALNPVIGGVTTTVGPGGPGGPGGGKNDPKAVGGSKLAVSGLNCAPGVDECPLALRAAKSGALSVKLACKDTKACSGKLEVSAKKAWLLKGKKSVKKTQLTYSIAAGKSGGLKLKLSKAGQKQLKKSGALGFKLGSVGSGTTASAATDFWVIG